MLLLLWPGQFSNGGCGVNSCCLCIDLCVVGMGNLWNQKQKKKSYIEHVSFRNFWVAHQSKFFVKTKQMQILAENKLKKK
jgi:hypothetical protein